MVKQLHHYGASATSREDWAATIRGREPFKAGGMSGRMVFDDTLTGDLPEPYVAMFRHGRPDYAVFSYETPIAWHDAVTDRWHVPNVNYSVTTTGHQGTVRMAVDTWDGERWRHDYDTGPHVNLREGNGRSPYGAREGW